MRLCPALSTKTRLCLPRQSILSTFRFYVSFEKFFRSWTNQQATGLIIMLPIHDGGGKLIAGQQLHGEK